MGASQDILFGKWPELKGQVRQRWGKLTGDDLARLNGKTEELVGVLQQRYGYGKAQAGIEINHWLSGLDRPTLKVKSASLDLIIDASISYRCVNQPSEKRFVWVLGGISPLNKLT